MKKIYKYPLEVTDRQTIKLPYDYRLLTVQNQNGTLYLWAVVDSDVVETTKITVRIFGTGNPAPELELFLGGDMEYISTVQMGSLMWHIFVYL